MTARNYGQYCGLAYALDLVGERWALLLIRDLILEPKRFTDLANGLPGIPTNVLSARLKELEENEILTRRVLPRPEGSIVYELTDYGRELEEIVLALGRWGSRSLREPRPGDALTANALLAALRASFQPDAAQDVRSGFELHMGELVVHAQVEDGRLEVGEGPLLAADLTLETDLTLVEVLKGTISAEDAIGRGSLTVTGDMRRLKQFTRLFSLPAPLAAAR